MKRDQIELSRHLQRRREQIVRQAANIVSRFSERDHVRVLHGHVEQIDLVRCLAAVEDALLNHRDFEVVRESIDDTGAYAAAGGSSGHQHAVGVDFVEHADQRRTEEGAGFLLTDDDVAFLRRDPLNNHVALVPFFGHIFRRSAVFGLPAAESDRVCSIVMTGCVKRRQMFLSRFVEKLSDAPNAFPTFGTTAIAKAPYGFENRFRLIADEIVVDVDDQHRGLCPKPARLP
jgi:hypothetical protein